MSECVLQSMLFDLKGNSTVTCADAVNYPSWYVYPPSYGTRSLTHVPAYEAGKYKAGDSCEDLPGKLSLTTWFDGTNGCEVYVRMGWCDQYGETDWNGQGRAKDQCCGCGGGVGNSTFGTIDISDTISSYGKYRGGVLAPNGKIYLVPGNADHIGELDPSTRTFGTIDISDTISSDYKYWGGVLAPNGKIYLVPNNADHIGELDPSTRTFGTIDISDTISSDWKYDGVASSLWRVHGPDVSIGVWVMTQTPTLGFQGHDPDHPSTGSEGLWGHALNPMA